mmetsp:Transcript_22561/g.64499  ORF Transcript_22561/g.64499 Transcript_22561/m.64499 type:complete len:98 (-) Transcript_22561:1660-1953(-)
MYVSLPELMTDLTHLTARHGKHSTHTHTRTHCIAHRQPFHNASQWDEEGDKYVRVRQPDRPTHTHMLQAGRQSNTHAGPAASQNCVKGAFICVCGCG